MKATRLLKDAALQLEGALSALSTTYDPDKILTAIGETTQALIIMEAAYAGHPAALDDLR